MIQMKDEEFQAITTYIKKNYGVNLIQKRTLIEGRLGNYIADIGFTNYKEYFEYAKNDRINDEMTNLINKLTTNHTYFLREKEHFDFYKGTILPWVDKGLGSKDLRIWSAGCSSGQEPYTLTMINHDYLGSNSNLWDHTILASDISDKVLNIAKAGVYRNEEVLDIPEAWLKKYFNKQGENSYVVSQSLRSNVAFRNLNLLSSFNFKKPFHTIFCRNVMIYFDVPTKNEIINKFYDTMMPGAYFIIGHSESLSACTHKFKYVSPSIYQKE